MKRKIVLLPLDERPCNRKFPVKLFSHDGLCVVVPEELGDKKKPADHGQILAFLERECRDADGLVVALDTLLYGGLIPSRLHRLSEDVLSDRLAAVKRLRKSNPRLKIFAFQVVMRCPSYSSSDEEPDYYDLYGQEINELGSALHRNLLGEEPALDTRKLSAQIDAGALKDYLERRRINSNMNLQSLGLVEEGIVDVLVIPQDDSARYGYAAMDQHRIRQEISRRRLTDKVLVYPGADEAGLTLISRMLNELEGRKPRVYVKYVSELARNIIPSYEGNALAGTVSFHLLSAGCRLADTYENADFSLILTAPGGEMEEASRQPSLKPEYYAERNLAGMIAFIRERKEEGRLVSIADNAYGNGGDLEVIRLLEKNRLLMAVDGYAGWNTSSNTLGTSIAQGVDVLHFGKGKSHLDFMVERYLEDAGYCSVVRERVTRQLPADMNYFDVKHPEGVAGEMVKAELKAFADQELSCIASRIRLCQVRLPWRRMFEVDLDAEYQAEA